MHEPHAPPPSAAGHETSGSDEDRRGPPPGDHFIDVIRSINTVSDSSVGE